MDTRKIRFVSNRPWLTEKSKSRPGPVLKTIPDWFRKASRFIKNPETGLPVLKEDGSRMSNWKACPAVFDIMSSGYTYKTPCDIEFYEDAQGNIQARVLDPQHQSLVQERMPLDRFPPPQGFHAKHFAWWADWAVELPEGYSALYTQPFNRFELPFWTMGGIVDNDKVHLPGTMPFFFMKGVTGIVPAGSPYAQIIPFKREHWLAEYDTDISAEEIDAKNRANAEKYRRPNGGVYFREVWERRKYQ